MNLAAFAIGPNFMGFPLRSHRNGNFIDLSSDDDDDNDSDLEDGDDDDDDDIEIISNVDDLDFGDGSSDGNANNSRNISLNSLASVRIRLVFSPVSD